MACVVVGGGGVMEGAHTTSGAVEGMELLLPGLKAASCRLAHTFMMAHPELRSAIQRHVVHLRRIQTSLTTNLTQQYRPTTTIRIHAGQVPMHSVPLEEEPLVGSCFEHGDGEAVGYENDKPLRLDAGNVGERWWLAGEH